jgi:hypothetical protein
MSPERRKVILFSAESLGHGDTIIGYEALANLLEVLIRGNKIPAAIVCLNTAVSLLGEDSPLLPRLKLLEEKGADIMAGRLCVNEMGLTDRLATGRIAPLSEIMEFLFRDDVDVISV